MLPRCPQEGEIGTQGFFCVLFSGGGDEGFEPAIKHQDFKIACF